LEDIQGAALEHADEQKNQTDGEQTPAPEPRPETAALAIIQGRPDWRQESTLLCSAA